MRAEVNDSDRKGDTALMLAVSCGDRLATMSLLEGRARVDARNVKGLQAIDMASDADVRSLLEEEANRAAISRQLGASFSLPSITKTSSPGASAKKTGVRLRFDGLSLRHSQQSLEDLLHDIIEEHRAPPPRDVEAVVDPISLRTCGRAYAVFVDEQSTKKAEKALLQSGLLVSVEAY
mmetsp:Transcript_115646/g.334096  ORF Transcript_115646/g.334096 Transcript_115646/m.334096 type:complete len:178 (-) Transcript_115646:102-635(-)